MENLDLDLNSQVENIQNKFKIIGRSEELKKILIAYYSKKNVLIEGEIGTGKTTLGRAFAAYMDKQFYRVDGSEDILSHVLVGFFDPPLVIVKGYVDDAFMYGPLAKSMKSGGVLFINELNRLPESSQNCLLSALDEGYLDIPKLPPVKSKSGFITITTMNPSAHVGVTNLGEALKDRFVFLQIFYQSEAEEIQIIKLKIEDLIASENLEIENELLDRIIVISVKIIEKTRNHPDLRRGASIRAGIDLASLILTYSVIDKDINSNEKFWYTAAHMALTTKVEIEDGSDKSIKKIIDEIVSSVLKDFQ
ncbi:MAG: AAA family ATPase [Promethearchaeota archaeon]